MNWVSKGDTRKQYFTFAMIFITGVSSVITG